MKCPSCNTLLQMTERKGIEIDYCPQCRGVWLDRGELDKIIAKTMNEEAVHQPQAVPIQQQRYAPPQHTPQGYDYDNGYHKKKHHKHGYKKHSKPWFIELFD